MRVAKLEALELVRDPQVGLVLAGTVALLHVVLLSASRLSPVSALATLVGVGPLALLFLAGPRRGAALESAFRRLVLTSPISPAEWFWGRAFGLQALTLAYLALVAPALLVELSVARAPAWAALNALVGILAFGALATFVGLALSTARADRSAGLLALVALAVLASYRLLAAVRVVPEGALRRAVAGLASLAPAVLVATAAGFGAPGDVPAWAIAVALAGTLVAAAGWSLRRHGVRAPHPAILLACWLGGAAAVGASVSFDGGGAGAAELADPFADADARIDLLAPLALVALAPLGVVVARRLRARS